MTSDPRPARSPPRPPSPAPPPAARLPLGRWREGPGAALALAIHGSVLAALLWGGTRYFEGGGGAAGPLGGGGRGGPAAQFLVLPPAPPVAVVDIPAPPLVAPPAIPLDVVMGQLPVLRLPDPGQAAGGTPGGAGDGRGPGPGTGVGAHTGPGSGGDAAYISLPSPRWTIVPPMNRPASVRGRQYVVKFWVTADGRVAKVEVEPEIRDGGYRRDFVERMKGYQFDPARNRDGRPVASVFTIMLTM